MPSGRVRTGIIAGMGAALAVLMSSGAGARESCEIAGAYLGKSMARGLCPAVEVALDIKDRQGSQCSVTGKATYNRRERDVECTRMEFEPSEGYRFEGALRLSFQKDDFLGFYGGESCEVMRLRIFMDSGTCEVELTRSR
jgi:hypothetical protein